MQQCWCLVLYATDGIALYMILYLLGEIFLLSVLFLHQVLCNHLLIFLSVVDLPS